MHCEFAITGGRLRRAARGAVCVGASTHGVLWAFLDIGRARNDRPANELLSVPAAVRRVRATISENGSNGSVDMYQRGGVARAGAGGAGATAEAAMPRTRCPVASADPRFPARGARQGSPAESGPSAHPRNLAIGTT
jgi:hypothetical protein